MIFYVILDKKEKETHPKIRTFLVSLFKQESCLSMCIINISLFSSKHNVIEKMKDK